MIRDFYFKKVVVVCLIALYFASFTFLPFSQAFALGGGGEVPEEYINEFLYGNNNSNSQTLGNNNNSQSAAVLTDTDSTGAYDFNVTNITEAIPAVIGCTGIVNKVKKTLDSFTDTVVGNGNIEDQLAAIMDQKFQILEEKKSALVKAKAEASQAKTDLSTKKPGTPEYTAAEKKAKDAEDRAVKADSEAAKADQNAKTAADNYTKYGLNGTQQSVPISNDGLERDANDTKKISNEIKKDSEQAKFREECINGVAYSLAKNQLAAMTQKTVNWINSGFGGDPLFVKNQDSYFDSLGRDTLRSFLGPIADFKSKDLYPYARDFARSAIQNNKATVEDKLRSTLRNSLADGATEEDFANDFSKGGWNGWFALTQKPQNNPLGFNILATQEIADQNNQKKQEARDELNQNNGFLSQKKCVEYEKTTGSRSTTPTPGYWNQGGSPDKSSIHVESKDSDLTLSSYNLDGGVITINMQYSAPGIGNITATLVEGATIKDKKNVVNISGKGKNIFTVSFGKMPASVYTVIVSFNNSTSSKQIANFGVSIVEKSGTNTTSTANGDDNKNCLRWEVVTPGTVIQDQLKNSLNSATRQLELADSINESLSAVFGALIDQLINQGLDSLSSFNPNNGTSAFGGPGSNKVYDANGVDVSLLPTGGSSFGNVLTVNRGRGWYSANDFDITTALGDKFVWQGTGANRKKVVIKKGVITIQKDYINAVNESLKVLPNIVPALGELDYCIPGPNNGWDLRTRIQVNALITYLKSIQFTDQGQVVTPDFKSYAVRSMQGTPMGEYAYANKDKWYVKAWDGYKNILESIPIIGGVSKTLDSIKGAAYDMIANIMGKPTRGEALAVKEADRVAAIAQKKNEFETGVKDQITTLKDNYNTYRAKIDELYGPNSLMRDADPTNPYYLPMAEAGLDATRNIVLYDINITTAYADYAEEVRKTKANIYKLNIIKEKVDKIVAAARKRLAQEIIQKQLSGQAVDLSCYENVLDVDNAGNIIAGPSGNTGSTQNTTGNVYTQNTTAASGPGGTNTANPGGTGNVGAKVKSDFSIIQEKYSDRCQVELTLNSNATGGTAPYTYLWDFKDAGGIVSSSNKTNEFRVLSTSKQFGNSEIKLTVTDKNGSKDTSSQTVTIAKQTLTIPGNKACPN